MFSKIRKRLTVTNAALALVLVFAMTGGAYAAKKYVITSTKQISPAVLKQLQGKAGPAGTPGAQGPAGPVGPAGTNGTGTNGKNGQNGTNGNNGTTGSAGPTGPTGPTGKTGTPGIPGTDGATGPAGPTGQTGFTETLPSGKTETGTWAVDPGLPVHKALAAISFTVPLSEILEWETNTHIVTKGAKGTGGGTCPTTSEASKPEAEPGNLCIFVGEDEGENLGSILPGDGIGGLGAGKTGTVLFVVAKDETKRMEIYGTWAVTAK